MIKTPLFNVFKKLEKRPANNGGGGGGGELRFPPDV